MVFGIFIFKKRHFELKHVGHPKGKERSRIARHAGLQKDRVWQFLSSLIPCFNLSRISLSCGHISVSSSILFMLATIENPTKCEICSVIRFLNAQNVRHIEIYRKFKQVYVKSNKLVFCENRVYHVYVRKRKTCPP